MDMKFWERIKPEVVLAAYEHDFKNNKVMHVAMAFFQTGEYSRCVRIINTMDRKGSRETIEFGYTEEDDFIDDGFELTEDSLYAASYFMYNEDISFIENIRAAVRRDDELLDEADAEFVRKMFSIKKEGAA